MSRNRAPVMIVALAAAALMAVVIVGSVMAKSINSYRHQVSELRRQVQADDGRLAAAEAQIKRLEARNRQLRFRLSGTTTANIWVDPSGGSCPRFSTPVAWTDGSACPSFTAAYQMAQPGDEIGVKGGTYGDQVIATKASLRGLSGCTPISEPLVSSGTITNTTVSTTNLVTIEPALGETVTINGKLEVHASCLWIKGTAVGTVTAPNSRLFNLLVTGYVDTEADSNTVYPDHVTITGFHATSVGTFNSEDVVYKDFDQGPASTGTSTSSCAIVQGNGFENKIGDAGSTSNDPKRVVWDRGYVHDNNRTVAGRTADCHFGALFLASVNGFTLRNSVFSQNWVYNIQVQSFGGNDPYPTNVLLENDWFGVDVEDLSFGAGTGDVASGQSDVQFDSPGTPVTGWTIRNNSFSTLTGGNGALGCYAGSCTYSGVVVYGNVGRVPSTGATQPCPATGVTYTKNAWVGGTCGGTDLSVSATGLYTSQTLGVEDFHLPGGSAAIDKGNPAAYPATDIDGNDRFAGVAPDAGASESGGSSSADTSPPTTPGIPSLSSKTQTSVTVSWAASTDNVGVTGYDAIQGGSSVATTGSTSYSFTGLTCGSTYTLGVRARDAAGNLSVVASAVFMTDSCAVTTTVATTGGCGDAGPLVGPTNLTVVKSSERLVTIRWTSATDPVRINKLVYYRDGVAVSSTGGINKIQVQFGVAPPTNHTLGVEAVDVCGRRATGTIIVHYTGTGWVAA